MIQKSTIRAATLLMLALGALTFTSAPAAAVGIHPAAAAPVHTHLLTKQIEWDHPISIATLLKGGSTHTSAATVQPDADINVLKVCSGSVYPVSYGGQNTWYTRWYNLILGVQYLYCSGGSVGYNFSYGFAYTTSSDDYLVYYGAKGSFDYDGASLHSPTGSSVCNGKRYTPAYICDEQDLNTYIVRNGLNSNDYSEPGPGNLQWSAQFWVWATDDLNNQAGEVYVESPTF